MTVPDQKQEQRRRRNEMITVGSLAGVVSIVGGVLYGSELVLPLFIFAAASMYVTEAVKWVIFDK